MSYQVLARKWRPRRFAELVGQEHVVRALSNALDTGRTHHAYLFTGTRGVGKTTIARIFAKSLNCEQGSSAEPCGECAVCQAVDEGRFVDLLEIDAASNTGVDDVREVIENAQYAPTRGRYKVYLIDEVHMLSRQAFNALLKTLEEPPPHVKFLLATTDPEKLPATVLSRCLRFNLKRLLPKQISGQMEHILQAESIEYEDVAIAELAHAADGSLRDGLSLLDQAISYGNGSLRAAEVRAMLGTVERSHLSGVLQALAHGDGEALLAECDHIAGFAPDYAAVLDELAMLLHRVQLHQLVDTLRDEAGDAVQVQALASELGAEDVQLYYQLAVSGRRDLGLAPNERTGFEMTLLRMLAFRPAAAGKGGGQPRQSRSATPRRDPAPARQAAPAPPQANAAASVPAPANVPTGAPEPAIEPPIESVTKVGSASTEWEALITKADLRGPLREVAVNATLQSLDEHLLTLGLQPQHAALAVEPMTGQMQDRLSKALGRPIKLRFVSLGGDGAETPAARVRATRAERQAQAEQAIHDDPLVQSLVRDFGAHVVPGSVRPTSTSSPEQDA